MLNSIKGMVVYHRKDFRCGEVVSSNHFTGEITVEWIDGSTQTLHVGELMSEKLYNSIKEQESINEMSLKKEQCVLNAVVYCAGKTAPLTRGKIVGPLNGMILIVEWDGGQLTKSNIKDLLSEEVGKAENQRLLDEAAKLEAEFEQAESEIHKKLSAAADLINDARKMASKHKMDIYDMYDATRELMSAINNAGWNTSSMSC